MKEIDWEQRRYEIAKDLYCCHQHTNYSAESAVKNADALIEELKKTSK